MITASLKELIIHGLLALRDTIQQDKSLNKDNVSIGLVSADQSFKILDGDDVIEFIEFLNAENPIVPRAVVVAGTDVVME